MKLPCLIPLIIFGKLAIGQTLRWDGATEWRLYNISTSRSKEFYPDSISYYKYISINGDTIQRYFNAIHQIPANQTQGIAWMGDYWASFNFRDSLKIIRVSRYGGFFQDMQTGLYYEIPIDMRASWQLYFTHLFLAVKAQ